MRHDPLVAAVCLRSQIIGTRVRGRVGKTGLIGNGAKQETGLRMAAQEVLEAGASLLEVRMGLVREGPRLVGSILRYLANNK